MELVRKHRPNVRQGFHIVTWLAACTKGSKMSMSCPLHSERTGEHLQAHVKDQHDPDTAQGLQEHQRGSKEHKKDRRGLATGSEGPDATSKTSFETLTPRAKAVADAARAAACQVIMTPGGPLPSPAGCPGHADFHAAVSGHDVRLSCRHRLHCSTLYCVSCFPHR